VGEALKNPIWLLSGFLGDENHWGDFPLALAHNSGVMPEVFNWFKETQGAQSLSEAARFLAQRAYAEGTRPVLVGYSMGGRLALQSAIEAPGAYSAIVALSAHPGFQKIEEREARQREDAGWAKLLRENVELFWKNWNQRGSLQDTTIPSTPQFDLSWAHLLESMGTGQQDFLAPQLAQSSLPPVLVVVGERDEKFVATLPSYPPNIQTHVLRNSGHRLPLEAPQELAQLLAPFIRQSQDIL
jgi:2-succinyl-6-hydroxy-2,4-cyclohexadiene-1-carboxylate synthase